METLIGSLMIFIALCVTIIMAIVATIAMVCVVMWAARLARSLIQGDRPRVAWPFDWF